MAIGLPIKIVVLTIVGMVGLATMLAFITNSEHAIPRSLHANIKNNSLIILSAFTDTQTIELPVEVMNSKDGTPVEKASVALFGLNSTSINITDSDGNTVLRFNKDDFELDASEGYLSLDVKANGFREYSDEYAVKVVN